MGTCIRVMTAGLAVVGAACLVPGPLRAADHGDGPAMDNDASADIGDQYVFVDPNDNTQVCLLGTFRGFIVPGEAVNFGAFDPGVRCRFDIENTGDAKPDAYIEVSFGARTAAGVLQTATIRLPSGAVFTAPTTPASLAATAPAQVVTDDATSGARFFAGVVDDPFFFDIPGFARFVASVRTGTPNPATLQRGRDTFAGYNTLAIALSLPRDLIRGASTNNVVGVSFRTLRRTQTPTKLGTVKGKGKFVQVDRAGLPAVNVALIPFLRKDAHNGATPVDDAKGTFVPDISATLTLFGTNAANTAALVALAVTTGDYARLDLTIPNTGDGGGDNAPAAFPNGRRLRDDVIDIVLTIVGNGTLGDNVNASDVPPQNAFPFLALPQQPRDTGVTDDNTRN